MRIAERDGIILRHARDADLPVVDEIAITCYAPIQESYKALLGQECYETVRVDPELTWQERKIEQVHNVYDQHPERLWVLEKDDAIVGFVTYTLLEEKSLGRILNNGVLPGHAGRGLGKFMYRHVLDRFRELGLRYAMVDTGLDDAHTPARRAYEGVGFDRSIPTIEYWQDLEKRNPGSEPD